MSGSSLASSYTGYSSCPLITSSKTCVLAEFNFLKTPPETMETFPFNQAKERRYGGKLFLVYVILILLLYRLMYHLKADMMPLLYWHGLVKGYWTGPRLLRKLLRAGADYN